MATADFKNIPDPYIFFEQEVKNEIAVNGHTETLYPVTAIDDANNGPIIFDIKATTDFIDFTKSYIKISGVFEGEVPAAGGAARKAVGAAGLHLGPINILPHALFTAVDVTVNNVNISLGDQNYMYRAYFETLFDYNKDHLKTTGEISGWVKDDCDDMDNIDSNKMDSPLRKRLSRKNATHYMHYIIRPVTPIFQMKKMMLPGCNIKISLQKNSESKFYLMHEDNGNFKFKITEALLKIRKVTVNPDYYTSVLGMMEKDNTSVEYILNCPRIITTNLLPNEKFYHRENVTFGHMPRRIIAALVETEAFTGHNAKNPFNFKHFNLRRIYLTKNGLEYPTPPINPDFTNKDYVEAYNHLMSSVDAEISPFVPNITEKDFANGFAIYSWDMSPDQYGDMNQNSVHNKGANIRLSLEFANPLATAATLIIYYLTEMRMTIDKTKQVTLEAFV